MRRLSGSRLQPSMIHLTLRIVWAEHTVTIVENPGGVQAIGFFVRTAHVTVPAAGYFFFEFDEALGFEDLIALALVNKGTSSGGVNQLGAFGRIDTVPNRIVYRSNRDDLTTSGITANYDWLMFAYQIDLRADNHETSRAYALDNLI